MVRTPDNALATTAIAPDRRVRCTGCGCSVDQSQYEQPPAILAVRTNTMTLTQMETVRDEVLGGSTGQRDQVFRLTRRPSWPAV